MGRYNYLQIAKKKRHGTLLVAVTGSLTLMCNLACHDETLRLSRHSTAAGLQGSFLNHLEIVGVFYFQ